MDSSSEVNSELRSRIRPGDGVTELRPGEGVTELRRRSPGTDSLGQLLHDAAVDLSDGRDADSRASVERLGSVVRVAAEPAPGATFTREISTVGGRDE